MLRKYLKGSFLIKMLGILIVSVLIHIISSHFELFELFNEFVAKNEKYNIDEFVTLFFAWFIYLFILVIIHQKTIHKQNKKQKELNFQLNEIIKQKNQLFSIIGHDLRNPFNTIIGFSDLLLANHKKIDSHKLEKMLFNINSATKKSYELLNNILDWGNILNTNLLVRKENFNLFSIIREEVSFLEHFTLKKNIKINNSVQKDIVVFADYHMIKTVIRNILSNAIKFSFKNNIIMVTLEKTVHYYNLSISDSGVGMNSEQISQLFKKRSISLPGTEGEKGTGLGLYICKEYMEKNNGSIRVNSKLNEGSEFIISIPLI